MSRLLLSKLLCTLALVPLLCSSKSCSNQQMLLLLLSRHLLSRRHSHAQRKTKQEQGAELLPHAPPTYRATPAVRWSYLLIQNLLLLAAPLLLLLINISRVHAACNTQKEHQDRGGPHDFLLFKSLYRRARVHDSGSGATAAGDGEGRHEQQIPREGVKKGVVRVYHA